MRPSRKRILGGLALGTLLVACLWGASLAWNLYHRHWLAVRTLDEFAVFEVEFDGAIGDTPPDLRTADVLLRRARERLLARTGHPMLMDGWEQPARVSVVIRGTTAELSLLSAGPDRVFDTIDDLRKPMRFSLVNQQPATALQESDPP
ncbi:MAG TPA: hypothetical protein VNA25_25145 [Phycisphaerae bacterium]|nr:hypothetical protein [Phycisphaerae bacterium]HUT61148.1 hypothetical protein [Phycisphaerae bacterium]